MLTGELGDTEQWPFASTKLGSNPGVGLPKQQRDKFKQYYNVS